MSRKTRLRFLIDLNPAVPMQVRNAPEQEATFLPMEAIKEHGGFDGSRSRPVKDLLTGYSYFENGDIAYAKVTPCFENGKITVLDNLDLEFGFGTTEVTVVRPNAHIDRRYLFYVLQEDSFKQFGKASMTGAGGLKRVPESFTKDFVVQLPELPQQKSIATFLDRETTEIDAFIADQEELIELLSERRTATITHAVTKGLNPNAPMKDSGVDWLGEIPSHWEVRSGRRFFKVRNEKAMAEDEQLAATQEFGVIKQQQYIELTGNRVVTVQKGFDILKHVEAGDFVISMRSFQGGLEYSEVSGKISSAYVMLTNTRPVFKKYVKYLFKSTGYISALRSTSNLVRDGQAMRFSNFAMVPIAMPPLSEQAALADFIEQETSEIDNAIADAREAIALSKERRAAVISAAVTGKIDVRSIIDPAISGVEGSSVGAA
ncbi:type I restriction endonuclease [Glutamicibacter uratoxydans]|uniref:Type I restriction endonuclease n=1 Tax=Glutamicibacter uratoxydans TaxID=43667 RepID=A0A4Y4DNJ1_GLUUR|nr:restriction endonuclease subunit S [Glutamicibacter uratoxydans]GED05454.1 type I restriction endonuclease [Glutamicibacter uratoxydans]